MNTPTQFDGTPVAAIARPNRRRRRARARRHGGRSFPELDHCDFVAALPDATAAAERRVMQPH